MLKIASIKKGKLIFAFASFVVLCFSSLPSVSAQGYKNDLKVGVGLVNYPSPAASNFSFYGELSRPFFPRTSIGISAKAVLPVEFIEEMEERKLSTYHFGLNLYFNIIEERKQDLKIGLGFSAGIFDTDWKIIDTGQMGNDHSLQPGLAILVEYNLIFDQRFILGVSAKGFLYSDDKNVFFAGLHGGFKF